MATEHVFLPLVKHELKWRRNTRKNRRRMPRAWRLTYAAFFIILVIALSTYGVLRGNIQFEGSWYFTWGLPFMIFGISLNGVRLEWNNETAGWWLALPYSRRQLVTSKFVATTLKGLMISMGIYILVAALTAYIMILGGHFSGHFVDSVLIPGMKWFLLLIAISPFAASVGTFMGILSHTKARPAFPLFWILFWIMFPLFGMHNFGSAVINHTGASFPYSNAILFPIIISWVLAFLIIQLAAYLLDRHLSL